MTAPRLAAGLAAFLFGLSSTVLLVALWGRAVVVDTDDLARSFRPVAQSRVLEERVVEWLEGELGALGVGGPIATEVVEAVLARPEIDPVMEDLLSGLVVAASSSDPAGSSVNVGEVLMPAAGLITEELIRQGIPVSEPQVAAALSNLDPLVILEPEQPPMVGSASPAAVRLGTATALGVAGMMIGGVGYSALSPDRVRAVRNLLTRFAVGAISFAFLLRAGSWILDPSGGRAPLGSALSRLALSKWLLPLGIGLGALGLSLGIRMWRRTLKPAGASLPIVAPATPQGD